MKTLEINLVNGKPIFSWCPNLEEGAINQIKAIAALPFVEHIAIMPDAHQGMECPIGSVIACNGAIVPSFVGVDISCGMATFRTNLTVKDINGKEDILHHSIERSIPMGFSHNTDERRSVLEQKYGEKIEFAVNKYLRPEYPEIVNKKEFASQLGTLGGG